MTLMELKRQYLEYLEIEKGRSMLTVRNYDHYLTRQLQPVADGILPFVDDDFNTLTSRQGTLF